MTLDDRQVDLFSRQVLLREVGGKGQERLLASRVMVLGAGPAAETAATYLAGAGVGTLGIEAGDGARGASGTPEGTGGSGFAPLRERCPDTRIVRVDSGVPVDARAWDVVVEVEPGGRAGLRSEAAPAASSGEASRAATGGPRLGSIRVDGYGRGGTVLLVVPASAGGCVECHEVGEEGSPGGAESRPARESSDGLAADLMLAGDLAALAACSFVLGLDSAAEARAFLLRAGGAVFIPLGVRRKASCQRRCSP